MKKEFTVKMGLEVQREQLTQWEKILKPEVFKLLKDYLDKFNSKLDESKHKGDDVPRGTTIDNLLGNYMLGHKMGSGHYHPTIK